jgi:hypothetical protein
MRTKLMLQTFMTVRIVLEHEFCICTLKSTNQTTLFTGHIVLILYYKHLPTRNDNILDLTLTTNTDIISGMEILPGMSNHCTVLFDVNVTAKRQRKPDRYVYQYKKGDIGGVKDNMKEYSDQFLKSNP